MFSHVMMLYHSSLILGVGMRCGPRPSSLPWEHSFSCGVYHTSSEAAIRALIDTPRFISPAIVNPALVDVDAPSDPVMRRGLMNIAKIMQNLANNIFFGKEFHMVPLNDFLSANIVNVTRFLSEINVSALESCVRSQ